MGDLQVHRGGRIFEEAETHHEESSHDKEEVAFSGREHLHFCCSIGTCKIEYCKLIEKSRSLSLRYPFVL